MSEAISRSVPVQSDERIQVVDVLRGFAILGILIFNMRSFAGLSYFAGNYTDLLDRIIVILTDFFVQAKFYSLFSFLFGWGMAVQMRRAERKGTKFFPAYFRRLLILLVIGAVHKTFLWTGDILLMYAVIGFMMLLFFRNSKPRTLLIAAGLLLLSVILLTLPGSVMDSTREVCLTLSECLAPNTNLPESLYATGTYWEVTKLRFQELQGGWRWFPCYSGNVFAMMLLGLYTGKRELFAKFDQHKNLFRWVMWIGLVVGVILNGVFTYVSTVPFQSPYFALIRIGSRTLGAPALTLFYITSITLLYQKSAWRERLAPLGRAGRMALTNYISHSLFLTFVYYGYGIGLYGITDPTFGLIFTLIIYRLQLQLSKWWFEHYKYGPLEWAWRRLAYNIRLPFSVKVDQDFIEVTKGNAKRLWMILAGALLILAIPLTIYLIQKPGTTPDIELSPEPTLVASDNQDQVIEDEIVNSGMTEAFQMALSGMGQPLRDRSGEIRDLMGFIEDFDTELALEMIEMLGGEHFQGRYTGTAGAAEAGDYLAGKFKEYGLFPVSEGGDYFQHFPVNGVILKDVPYLGISTSGGSGSSDFYLHTDFQPVLGHYAGSGTAEGKVMWAVDCTESDFSHLDVVGMIAFCKAGDIEDQARRAAKNGAAGLLLLSDPNSTPPNMRLGSTQAWVPDPIPVFQIYDRAAAELLSDSGYTIRDLSLLYHPLELVTSAKLEIRAISSCGEDACSGRNILGVFPGWDPDYKDQVIILSANYDGLGSTPEGQIWPGANWNGSGVGVLLEIANSWHQADFLPRVTVLFALWDAEKQDSLGADYFINNPIYPLEDTLAVIHLDGVGSGSNEMLIDGSVLAEQVERVIAEFGLESVQEEEPERITRLFQGAEVPFVSLSWAGERALEDLPEDQVETIETDKLDLAGKISEMLLLQLGDIAPQISDLIARRCEALAAGDITAFYDTGTTASGAGDSGWFAEIQDLTPSDCTSSMTDLRLSGDTASVRVSYLLTYPGETDEDERTLTIPMEGKLEFGQDGWLWDGPALLTADWKTHGNTAIQVHYHQGISDQVDPIAEFVLQEYARITGILSLSSRLEGHIYLYPTRDLLKADTMPTSQGAYADWIGIDTLKFSSNPLNDPEDFRTAIVGLILENHGLTSRSFPWLWDGLPQLLREDRDGILLESDSLDRFRDRLEAGDIPSTSLGSWAAVEYLQQTIGWGGIGQLIADLGEACQEGSCEDEGGGDLALTEALAMDQETLDNAWSGYWLDALDQAQKNIDQNLAQRTEAVLDGDLHVYLETVDPSIPNLLKEEEDWFAANAITPLEAFRLSARPIALLEDGGLIASMTMEYQLEGITGYRGRGSIPVDVLFTAADGELLWGGPIFEMIEDEMVRVRYPEDVEAEALVLFEKAGAYYQELAAAMEVDHPQIVTINLYEDKPVYEGFISLSHDGPDWDPGWSAPGHSVKFFVSDALADDFILVRHLSRNVLSQLGVENEWLLNGGSAYLAGDAAGGILENRSAASLISLNNTIKREEEFDLGIYPDLYLLSEYNYKVALAQAWDSLRYLAESFGEDVLSDLLRSNPSSSDLDQVLSSLIGLTIDEFTTAWKASLLKGHIPSQYLEISQGFDPDQALDHLAYLISPALGGRQSGSDGSALAAVYIKDKFTAYGLITGEQYFPVNYQTYLETPRLEFLIDGQVEEFFYREDFLVLQPEDTSGAVSGELIWIADQDYPDMDLTGKIAIRTPSQAIPIEIQNAMDHGASALILIGDKNREEDLLSRYPFRPSVQDRGFPVYELTRSGFERLLDLTGMNKAMLDFTVPAVWMDVQAVLEMSLSSAQIQQTSNVIGYLPGSDPNLREDLIIIGAHYDHVGDELGTAYRGENDNASGVAALLEIARLWNDADYHPRRSVLFIAWGGQEGGELGSAHYLSHPLYPLENIVATLQLDGIGNGDGYYLEAYGDREKDGLIIFDVQKASEGLETRLLIAAPERIQTHSADWLYSPSYLFSSERLVPTSDAHPFRDAGISTLLFRWKDNSEKNLPDGLAFEVLPERLAAAGKTISATLMMLAR